MIKATVAETNAENLSRNQNDAKLSQILYLLYVSFDRWSDGNLRGCRKNNEEEK